MFLAGTIMLCGGGLARASFSFISSSRVGLHSSPRFGDCACTLMERARRSFTACI